MRTELERPGHSSAPPRVYLLDVEGTVAPISLVYEQLFPYARAHFAAFLEESKTDPAVTGDLHLLNEENRAETDPSAPRIAHTICHPEGAKRVEGPAFRESALTYLNWLMDRDRKSTALKSLQGRIWKAGFESGELKGTLFADVPDALRRWAAGASVAIYSSGSVEAQRLLFRHSIFGDLTGLIAAHFDTRTGPKAASASYAAIATAMKVEPGDVLFFSDVVRELDAAREAGCQTRLAVREGNAAIEDVRGHAVVESFELL
jgi:2,3-diketo-5-methylthio-1-phosphopentane phosphatase